MLSRGPKVASLTPSDRQMLPLAAAASIVWLAGCIAAAWLICVPLDLPRTLFGATAAALGTQLAKPRELIETVTFLLFVATWFPAATWFATSGVARLGTLMTAAERRSPPEWLWAPLPWLFLAALYLFGQEITLYMTAPLKFKDWAFFQNFTESPRAYSALAVLVAAVVLAAAKAPPLPRRLTEAVSFVMFWFVIVLVATNVAFVAPTEGYAPDADTHHKAAVLAPVADFMQSGESAKSQYGSYYVWAGAFAKFVAASGTHPLVAVDAFFFLALVVSFAIYGLAARLASGSWTIALLALGASIAFAGIRFRSFSYLQVEPIRWLFPAICLAAYAAILRRGKPGPVATAAAFALVPFALHWNPETGLACAGALFFCLFVATDKRSFAIGLGGGLLAGGILLVVLSSAAAWYCAAGMPAGPAVARGPANPLFAFAFLDIVSAPAPVFHLWQLLWLLACTLFVSASRRLRQLPPGADSLAFEGTVQLGAAMALFLFFYYQGISVPGTLRALSFSLILALALVAYRALTALASSRSFANAAPAQVSAAALLVPLACLAVLAPLNGGSMGRTFDPTDMDGIAKEGRTIGAVCELADKVANGKEVLYLSQDAWWYALSCVRPVNRGLVAPTLIHSKAEWAPWLARAEAAGAIVFEEALFARDKTDHARMRAKIKDIVAIVERRNLRKIRVQDAAGNSLLIYSIGKPE